MLIKDLKIIGAPEVRKICGFTSSHLNRLVRDEKIPAVKISNSWVFLLNDVIEFQKRREIKSKKDGRIKIKK